LGRDELSYLLALFAVIDSVLLVLVAYLINNLILEGVEGLIYKAVELVLALCKLLADVVRQALDVVGYFDLA
jgi:hypothetical protein